MPSTFQPSTVLSPEQLKEGSLATECPLDDVMTFVGLLGVPASRCMDHRWDRAILEVPWCSRASANDLLRRKNKGLLPRLVVGHSAFHVSPNMARRTFRQSLHRRHQCGGLSIASEQHGTGLSPHTSVRPAIAANRRTITPCQGYCRTSVANHFGEGTGSIILIVLLCLLNTACCDDRPEPREPSEEFDNSILGWPAAIVVGLLGNLDVHCHIIHYPFDRTQHAAFRHDIPSREEETNQVVHSIR